MAFTIASAKEAGETRMPIYLFDFEWPDGSTLSVSTHDVSKGGTDYLARVMDQEIDGVQALGPTGMEIPPSVRVTLADADKSLYGIEFDTGFFGALLTVSFAYYDLDADEWSTDTLTPFVGRCGEPETVDDALRVTAEYVVNLEAQFEPRVPVQPRCWKPFPASLAAKAEANTEGSIYFPCGVTDPAKTSCAYTQAGCDVNVNSLRFGGLEHEVPPASRSREYTTGDWLTDLVSDPNGAKSGDMVPLVFGTAWVEPVRLGSWPEGNSTRGEAIVCEGRPESILKVVVAGEDLPGSNDLDYNSYIVTDPLLRYDVVANGDRTGRRNPDAPWNGAGDPHGSQCTIAWVVYHKLTTGLPDIQVLVKGPKVLAYAPIDHVTGGVATLGLGLPNEDIAGNAPYTVRIFGNSNAALNATWGLTSWAYGPPGTVTLTGTGASGTGGWIEYPVSSDRYAWSILRLLRRAGVPLEKLDLTRWAQTNARHRTLVAYTKRDGTADTHPMFTCGLVVKQRQSVAGLIGGMLRGCQSHLGRDPQTGLYGLYFRDSLAGQQPAAVTGSNDNVALAGGYLAYHFAESDMVDDRQRVTRRGRSVGQAPNTITVGFANEENDYSGDSVVVADTAAIERAGQQVQGSWQALGCTSLDRANRIAAVWLAEQGARGAWRIPTTAKAVYLRVGHLVGLTHAKHGWNRDVFRVQQVAPGPNYETAELLVTQHDDAWYADDFTSVHGSTSRGGARDKLARPAWSWAPYSVRPESGDPVFARTDWTFGLQLDYVAGRGGQAEPVITVRGVRPVNAPVNLRPPVLAAQGTTASSGGTVPGDGRVYWIALASRDADGKPGPVSRPCRVVVAQAGSTNTITAAVLYLDSTSSGYFVFVGVTADRLRSVNDAGFGGTPSTVTVTALPGNTWGAPDVECNELVVRPRYVWHAGVWGAAATAVGTRTLQVAGAGWTVNQWAGYDVMCVAKADLSALGVLNFRVASNTADTLTIDGTSPDPNALGVTADDVLIMWSKPTVSGRTLTDANWANTLSGGVGLTAHQEKGRVLRIVANTGRGYKYLIADNTSTAITVATDWVVTPDSTSRYVIEDAAELPEVVSTGALGDNSDRSAELDVSLAVRNYAATTLLVEVVARDGGGAESAGQNNPVRIVYVQGAQGTRQLSANGSQRATDGTILYDTSTATGGTTTLAAAITDTDPGTITLASAAGLVDGQYIQVGTEKLKIVSGGGTTTPFVDRGQLGTTAATHTNGSTVTYGGVRTFTCLSAAAAGDRELIVRKRSSDLNGVKVVPAGGDTFPGGSTAEYLWDNTADGGTLRVKFVGGL